jgi:signal transduction histidine kinase
LRPLDGFSQTLLEDYGSLLDDTARGYLLKIRQASQRMSQLIDDLLRLSRISSVEVRPGWFNLSELVSSIAAELRASEPARQVEFSVQPDLRVYADAALLRIALENLLRNAWKFTSKRARARIEFGRLEPSAAEDGAQQAYFVRDDGVGFDMTHAARLGQPFQRFHSTKQFEGTGIGLAIVELVLRHHRGRLWAESTPDHGASFFFALGEPADA